MRSVHLAPPYMIGMYFLFECESLLPPPTGRIRYEIHPSFLSISSLLLQVFGLGGQHPEELAGILSPIFLTASVFP